MKSLAISQDLKKSRVSIEADDLTVFHLFTHVMAFVMEYDVEFDEETRTFSSGVLCKKWYSFFDLLSDMFRMKGGFYHEN